jgi:hypothetical protein
VLRTIVESEGNSGELIADIIFVISDIVRMHPRWVDLGLAWLEAFDKINLASIRKVAKATAAAPLHSAVMVLLCAELERLLGPSKLLKPPRVKREPKPPVWLTRVPGVEKNIHLGLELLALRSAINNNRAYGRQVRRQFDVETKLAIDALNPQHSPRPRARCWSGASLLASASAHPRSAPPAGRARLGRRGARSGRQRGWRLRVMPVDPGAPTLRGEKFSVGTPLGPSSW